MKDRDWIKNKLIRVYHIVKEKNLEIIIILLVVFLCIVMDIIPWKYFPLIENIFSRKESDYGTISAMTLTVWTFTTALIIYWMGRMEDKLYGIQMWRLYLKGLSLQKGRSPYNKLMGMCVAFVVELMAVFAAALYRWEITLTVMVVLHILTMAYVFLMICIEGSETNVLEQIMRDSVEYIKQQKDAKQEYGINSFLVKMVESTNYKNDYEIGQLNNMIKRIVDENNIQQHNNLRWFMKSYIDYIIKTCVNREISTQIVKYLMNDLVDRHAKEGIFLSVIENDYQENSPDIADISSHEFGDRRIIIATGLVYNGFYYIVGKESHRKYVEAILKKRLLYKLEDNELRVIFEIWYELIKEQENKSKKEGKKIEDWSLDKLWKIISMEGEE